MATKTGKRVSPTGAMRKAATSNCTAKGSQTNHPLSIIATLSISPEEFSSIFTHLSLDPCVELTRRLLTVLPKLPTGTARPWAFLKAAVFVAVCGSADEWKKSPAAGLLER